MEECIVNSGRINVLVCQEHRTCYILDGSEQARRVVDDFIEMRPLSLEKMSPFWFAMEDDEAWVDFDGKQHGIKKDHDEASLVEHFTSKKHNFGGLVARRNRTTNFMKVYKKEKIFPRAG